MPVNRRTTASGSRTPRQAAAEAEHIVVRGSKAGGITLTMIRTDVDPFYVPETNELDMSEHYQDPPFGVQDLSGDDREEDAIQNYDESASIR